MSRIEPLSVIVKRIAIGRRIIESLKGRQDLEDFFLEFKAGDFYFFFNAQANSMIDECFNMSVSEFKEEVYFVLNDLLDKWIDNAGNTGPWWH
jgi:hypothetical protein